MRFFYSEGIVVSQQSEHAFFVRGFGYALFFKEWGL